MTVALRKCKSETGRGARVVHFVALSGGQAGVNVSAASALFFRKFRGLEFPSLG